MSQESNLKKLIQKVSSGLPQIQSRSLNNIYNKIAHQIINPQTLLQYQQFPGMLMTWINQNKRPKSDNILFKVICLLSFYTNFDKGLILLRQYECLQFCEEFKIYLVQNERGIDDLTQELDVIIHKLLPLGRADQPYNKREQNQISNDGEDNEILPNKIENKGASNNEYRGSKTQVKQVLKFKCQNLQLNQVQDKAIFEMFMRIKYADKAAAFSTLTLIRRFVSHYSNSYFRCKADLITHLCEISLANILPQVCMEIVAKLIQGLINSQIALHSPQSNDLINLTYASVTSIPALQTQIILPLKIFDLPESFIVIKQLLKLMKLPSKYIPLPYLLSINYKHSPKFMLKLIGLLDEKQLIRNMSIYMPSIEQYSLKFPHFADDFIHVLPESVWRKAKGLVSVYNSSEKKFGFRLIEQYLNPKEFQLTKNLHMMRQIIDNLKQGIKGIQLSTRQAIRFYLDVLLVLAISVSRQDPLMSYFNQAQQLFLTIANHSNKQVAISAYTELLEGLKNSKPTINYPGMIVSRYQIIEIIFTSPQFTKRLMQCSLQLNEILTIMLSIVSAFISKEKFKIFAQFVPIFYALCNHPCESVNIFANQIISKMPKSYTVISFVMKLFSTDVEVRKKVLTQLTGQNKQVQIDLVERISQGHFVNKKKQLKISAQSIQNYLNIVLNPSLQINIKETAINEFIDYLERAEGSNLPQLQEAQLLLAEQIKGMSKKQSISNFEEKLITLHLVLSNKKESLSTILTLQYLVGLLHKVKSMASKVGLLTSIYVKVFESPFSKEPLTQNWAMMHYPHIQIIKMNIQQTIRPQQEHKNSQNISSNQVNHVNKSKKQDKFQSIYLEIIQSICNENKADQQLVQIVQEQVVAAVTTTDILRISKLSFLFAECYWLKILKPTFKILLQYARTNPAVHDIPDQLSLFIKSSNQIHEFVGNFDNLTLLLISFNNKSIGNEEIQKIFKLIEDPISNAKVYYALATQPAIKFSSLNEYNGLKIIQSIISTIRSGTMDSHNRCLALILLNRIVQSQFKIEDHAATLLTLLRSLLFENRVNTLQFAVALNCCAGLITKNNIQNMGNSNLISSFVEQLCILIFNLSTNSQNEMLIAASFSFLNEILRNDCISEDGQYPITQLIIRQPNNMVILASSLIPKNIECDQNQCSLVSEIYTFLYLLSIGHNECLFVLLNSTDILSTSLKLIITLVSSTKLPTAMKTNAFDTLGRLIYNISINSDQFIFKLNKITRSDATNAEYKLHYTLMAPIPIIKEYYQNKPNRLNDYPYIKMICRLLYIWKQQSKILQENDYIQPIIACILQTKQLKLMTPLLFKSNKAQKLAANSMFISEKFKLWTKSVQQLIYDKTKNKKGKQSPHDIQNHFINLDQGLAFTAAIFSSVQGRKQIQQTNNSLRETIIQCIKFMDQVYYYLEIQFNQSVEEQWTKALKNLFKNEVCSKTLSAIINEGNFQCINKLIVKIQKSSLPDASDELELLGSLSSNESIRSLIIKHRIIETMLSNLIAMDENKVAKINYTLVYCIASFLFYLSAFKQTNAKIQGEKKVIEAWAKILGLQQSEVVEDKVLNLLINLATFKHSKAAFMASKEIHKVSMGLLSDPDSSHKQKILMLLYNILYKNAAGIKMYKRKQVCELLSQLSQVQELHDMTQALLEVINSQD